MKIGDRVKLTTNNYGDSENNPIWGGHYGRVEGVIFEHDYYGTNPISIKWENGTTNDYNKDDLTLLEQVRRPDIDEIIGFGS